MARRSDHNRDELKELALNAAHEIVVKEGYRELSARKIASKIGYTAGTLYNLFSDLNELVLHMNAKTLDSFYETLEHEVQSAKNKEQAIYKTGKCYVDFSHKNYQLWNMLFEHHVPRPKGAKLPAWYEKKMYKPFSVLENALLPYVKGNKGKCSHYTKVLWAGLHGICILSISGKLATTGSESAHSLANSLIKTFILGLK